jgi:hypothetical protein
MAAEFRPDIQAARGRMHVQSFQSKLMKKIPEYLWETETVEMLCQGLYAGGQRGLLTLTNRRLLFFSNRRGSGTMEDFQLRNISSVRWSTAWTSGIIRLFASGNETAITSVDKTDGKAIVDRICAVISGHTDAAPVTAPAPSPPPPGIPAGWFPDADNDKLLRYWDGQTWTEHTAPRTS